MSEGDTIWRTAHNLDRALGDHELVRFVAPRLVHRPFPPGTVVEAVDAVGKHCLVHFDDGRVLRTHLRMQGSWHLYRPGERWRRARGAMRVLVEAGGWVAVCFAAPEVELTDGSPESIGHLGPDLSYGRPDVELAVRRLGELAGPGRAIADALLDQRIACGVGNVYKSEALFACGVDPFTPVAELDDDARRRIIETAAAQLQANLRRASRDTTGGAGLAVYGRRGRPCLRCGTTIAWRAQGEHRRGTYWCPACQPSGSAQREVG
jgi:endonuclease-8